MKTCLKAMPKLFLVVFFLSTLPGVIAAQEYTTKGADSCLKCHKSDKWSVMPIFNTKHGSRTDPDSPFSSMQCESCHGPSNGHVTAKKKADVKVKRTFGANDQASVVEQNEPLYRLP